MFTQLYQPWQSHWNRGQYTYLKIELSILSPDSDSAPRFPVGYVESTNFAMMSCLVGFICLDRDEKVSLSKLIE